MTTIAELIVKVDSTQAEKGTKALNALAEAADKAAKARKALNDAQAGAGGSNGGGGGGSGDAEARKTKNLSDAIDAQTRKLSALAARRKELNDSPLKTENPAEYARLNREIDSRTELVRRQGNSLDRLAAQEERAQKQRDAAAKASKVIADREAREIEVRERAAARYAAQQQRDLDATLAGLSKQIKAQQDYNKAIETLNLQRFQGKIGGAEYDTYVRMAQARRDDTLAAQDNTRELERNQRMLDSITATLGKAERAEFQYSKALSTLNESLRLGLVTQTQYDTQLAAHASKRDAAIVAANDGASAQGRLAAQLRNVLSAYNPIISATDSYSSSVAILRQGLQAGEITMLQYVKALREQKAALDQVKAAQPGSADFQAKQYQSALDRLLPFNAQLRNLEQAERHLQQAQRDGLVVSAQQIKNHEQATKAIIAERAEIERRSQAERRGNSAKQDQAALRGLPAQFTDVVVSLQGGQAPLTVLLQQGGQLKDMFGGILPMLKAVGTALLGMITPITGLVAVIGVMAYAWYEADAEIRRFNKASAETNNWSGVSIDSFQKLQKSISDTVGTMSLAAEVLTLMEKTGKISAEQFEAVGIAAIKMSRITGKAAGEIVDEFASLSKDPTQAVVTLDEKYKFLTGSIYLAVAALQKQGRSLDAAALAQAEMAKGVDNMADKILPRLGHIEKIWTGIKDAIKGARDELIEFGRESADPDQARLAEINKELLAIEKRGQYLGVGFVNQRKVQLELEKKGLIDQIAANKDLNDQKDKKNHLDDRARQASLTLSKTSKAIVDQNMSQVERYTTLISALKTEQQAAKDAASAAGIVVAPDVLKKSADALAAYEKKLKEAKEAAARSGRGGSSPLDTTEIQEVKSNLNLIISEYAGYYKKVTALGKTNVVSAAATVASQIAILKAEASAVDDEYGKQISAIKKLQGQKSNNAAQNISLTNQLTKAEDQRTKFMQENSVKQEKLDIEERGRLAARTEAILAYNDALKQQIENVRISGERSVAAVGQGDRQGKLNEDLAEVDRQFAKDQMSLSKQLGKGMDSEEYAQKLSDLKDAHSEMTKQILENDKDIKEAEGDWTNGITRAIQNYADAAGDFASLMENVVSGAFESMGDALGEFVTTGKLDFKSLASSILADMAKIAAKAATNAALSSLFSAGMAAFSGWSQGTGVMTGSSEFGTIQGPPKAMAKGGGWSKGTQFFAKGGAFTNGIVSSATSFGMGDGGKGVMGEAGPEAIMPLARSSDGSLGVRMLGGQGGGSGGVYVNIIINSDGSKTTNTDSDSAAGQQFGKEIGDFVDNRYRVLLARDLKDGGAIKSAMK